MSVYARTSQQVTLETRFFSVRFSVRVMSIIWFIALVASISLKYLPILEIKTVPLPMGMEVFILCSLQISRILSQRQTSIHFCFR